MLMIITEITLTDKIGFADIWNKNTNMIKSSRVSNFLIRLLLINYFDKVVNWHNM